MVRNEAYIHTKNGNFIFLENCKMESKYCKIKILDT